jgi:hypothetical protein
MDISDYCIRHIEGWQELEGNVGREKEFVFSVNIRSLLISVLYPVCRVANQRSLTSLTI